jgi:glycosyltransferase involved in cell wall biosynthesis
VSAQYVGNVVKKETDAQSPMSSASAPVHSEPLVSALIPVFNGAATVGRAIESALAQSFARTLEVIVVNDGSTDSTPAVLMGYYPRIIVVNQPNRGLAAARNAGAAIAKGEYLAFLDADDVWLPNKLALTTSALDRASGAVLAYSDITPVDNEGDELPSSPITPELAHAPSIAELLTRWWPILPSAVVMRRNIYEMCGGFCERFRRSYEDVDLWLRAREHGTFLFLGESLLRYRTTPIPERMGKYEDDYAVFEQRVRERYGTRARMLLRATRQAYVSALGHGGLTAMREGDMVAAREKFLRALRYDPMHIKTALRLARTFLPKSVAQALTGGSRRAPP